MVTGHVLQYQLNLLLHLTTLTRALTLSQVGPNLIAISVWVDDFQMGAITILRHAN